LEGFRVGYFQDQSHTVGLRGIGEELARDAHGPEELLPLGRVKPVFDVVDFVEADVRCHVTNLQVSKAADCLRSIVAAASGEDIT